MLPGCHHGGESSRGNEAGDEGGFLEEGPRTWAWQTGAVRLDVGGEMAFASVARCPGPRCSAVRKCL